jgi:hypothetical protein
MDMSNKTEALVPSILPMPHSCLSSHQEIAKAIKPPNLALNIYRSKASFAKSHCEPIAELDVSVGIGRAS